ncbi:Complement C1q-like protein 2 [Mactra antiquata]
MKVFICAVALCVLVCIEASVLHKKSAPVRRQQGSFVAFSAGLTSMVNLTTNGTVVFNKEFIDLGDTYDNQTGVFTCSRPGVYMFLYHGLSETSGQMWLDLYKNGAYEITAYAHNGQDYAAASNSILMDLNVGDTVFIRGHGSSQLYGTQTEVYATFSGYLLSPGGGGQ